MYDETLRHGSWDGENTIPDAMTHPAPSSHSRSNGLVWLSNYSTTLHNHREKACAHLALLRRCFYSNGVLLPFGNEALKKLFCTSACLVNRDPHVEVHVVPKNRTILHSVIRPRDKRHFIFYKTFIKPQ